MRILIQPAANPKAKQNFIDTVKDGVFLDSIKDLVSESNFKKLKSIKKDYIEIWGMKPFKKSNNRPVWNELEGNEKVLFYGDSKFYYQAEIFLKIRDQKLAEKLWGIDIDGETWKFIYFFKNGCEFNIPYNHKIIGYGKGPIMQPVLLKGKKANDLSTYIKKFTGETTNTDDIKPSKSDIKIIQKRFEKKSLKEVINELGKMSIEMKDKPAKEKIKKAKAIVRNPRLARLIKERDHYICQVCGIKGFEKKNGDLYAEAHHIDELAESRLDIPENMTTLCATCHRIIHYGSDAALAARKELK